MKLPYRVHNAYFATRALAEAYAAFILEDSGKHYPVIHMEQTHHEDEN